MPRRIAGPIWAIRITATLTSEEEEQFKIPNTVCVYHGGGSRSGKFTEKPHYHLYYNAGEEVVKEKVQEMIKANVIVQKYYKASNGFWSVDTDEKYDLKGYWDYVWRDYPLKKQRLIWWDIPEPQLEIPEAGGLIVAPGPLDAFRGASERVITHVVVKEKKKSVKTSAEKQEMFLEYCKDYYEDKPHKPRSQEHVCYLLVKYCSNFGFTPDFSLSTWARYAWCNLVEKPERKQARMELARTLANKFF